MAAAACESDDDVFTSRGARLANRVSESLLHETGRATEDLSASNFSSTPQPPSVHSALTPEKFHTRLLTRPQPSEAGASWDQTKLVDNDDAAEEVSEVRRYRSSDPASRDHDGGDDSTCSDGGDNEKLSSVADGTSSRRAKSPVSERPAPRKSRYFEHDIERFGDEDELTEKREEHLRPSGQRVLSRQLYADFESSAGVAEKRDMDWEDGITSLSRNTPCKYLLDPDFSRDAEWSHDMFDRIDSQGPMPRRRGRLFRNGFTGRGRGGRRTGVDRRPRAPQDGESAHSPPPQPSGSAQSSGPPSPVRRNWPYRRGRGRGGAGYGPRQLAETSPLRAQRPRNTESGSRATPASVTSPAPTTS